jgi:hypothetical protein
VRRRGQIEQGRRPRHPIRHTLLPAGIPILLLLAGCHSSDSLPPAPPAPQAMPAPAPAVAAPEAGQGTLGDLARETEWRRRTADKLRRLP